MTDAFRSPPFALFSHRDCICACQLDTHGRQGILFPRPDIRIQPFYVRDLRVNTTIHDAIAETSVEQTFVNTSSVEQEGTYLYPLPEGAAPTAFSMTVGRPDDGTAHPVPRRGSLHL